MLYSGNCENIVGVVLGLMTKSFTQTSEVVSWGVFIILVEWNAIVEYSGMEQWE